MAEGGERSGAALHRPIAVPLLDRLHADAVLVPLDYCPACRVDRADAPQSALSDHGDRLGFSILASGAKPSPGGTT